MITVSILVPKHNGYKVAKTWKLTPGVYRNGLNPADILKYYRKPKEEDGTGCCWLEVKIEGQILQMLDLSLDTGLSDQAQLARVTYWVTHLPARIEKDLKEHINLVELERERRLRQFNLFQKIYLGSPTLPE